MMYSFCNDIIYLLFISVCTIEGCGYNSCPKVKDGYLNVHIVPHSHDDVGWLKTFDQYYYGTRNGIQNAQVQYILDSVIGALLKDENRRFIYVETAFFWKWWNEQKDSRKSLVKELVQRGQLEFIGGGWSMNDEAVTNYQSIIDQMTLGMEKLKDTFGECGRPKIGWQIDSFGHSSEMASIFAQLGFDGLLLGRIDYEDAANRKIKKTMEMVWRGSRSLGNSSDIFTGIIYNIYGPPGGLCFDIRCYAESIIDDKDSPDYNIEARGKIFLEEMYEVEKYYKTRNIIIAMGSDFDYMVAEMWYGNIEKLMRYFNQSNEKINLIYSTPSCYVKAVRDESKGKFQWQLKTDDFLPYRSVPHRSWTGFYTSRPTLKRYERYANNFLQINKQLYALANLGEENRGKLDTLREAVALMQHHDAITGTEKQKVAYDYARRLAKGIDECSVISQSALRKFLGISEDNHTDSSENEKQTFIHCPLLNISQCNFTETHDNFVVTVYNPLSTVVSKYIRLPILGDFYSVKGPKGEELTTDILPIPMGVQNIPGRNSKARNELIFQAKDIQPLGFKSYFVQVHKRNPSVSKKVTKGGPTIEMDSISGRIKRVTMNNQTFALNQNFFYYDGFTASSSNSGAYVFRPKELSPIEISNKTDNIIFEGNLLYEVHQKFTNWTSQVIRIYHNENVVEFDWVIGPIPRNSNLGRLGKEVVTRYTTNIDNRNIFFTDSNGREMIERKKNDRSTWNIFIYEPVADNYYPVTSKIVIKDSDREMAVLTDRAEGGSSLRSGEVELMLHRICISDDGLGVSEALMEEAFNKLLVARGSHFTVLGTSYSKNPNGKSTAAQARILEHQIFLSAWTFLSPTNGLTFEHYKAQYKMEFAGLKESLPENIKILTLEPWKESKFLLRLEHIFPLGEDSVLSKPVTLNLKDIFATFEITAIRETTLGGNQWLEDNQRLQFDVGGMEGQTLGGSQTTQTMKNDDVEDAEVDSLVVKLNPMQIRTFIIDIKSKY